MAGEPRTFKRSPVTKMLIAEAARTTCALPKAEGQYETQMYLSPTGRVVGKVVVVGTAVDKEDLAQDNGTPFWRVRIADPTGSIGVTTGQYQPEATQAIAELQVPAFVAVVGKIHIYEPEEGNKIVSIRPDSITVIDENTRDALILDASVSTARSIKKCNTPEIHEQLNAAGYKEDLEAFRVMTEQAVMSLLLPPPDQEKEQELTPPKPTPEPEQPQPHQPPQATPTQPPKKETKDQKKTDKSEKPEKSKTPAKPSGKKKEPLEGKAGREIDESIHEIQDVLIQIFEEHNELNSEDLPDLLKKKDINPNMVDWWSAVKRLMDEGRIYEPRIGRLKYSG